MKKNVLFVGMLAGAFMFMAGGCASIMSVAEGSNELIPNVSLGENESLLVLKRNANYLGSAIGIKVFLDGQEVGAIYSGGKKLIPVANGKHTIKAVFSKTAQTGEFTFEVYSKQITYGVGVDGANGGLALIKVGEVALAGNAGQGGSRASGIEGALEKASEETLKGVSAKARIAIVYITAQDKWTIDFIAGELEYLWVKKGYFITDRGQLDRLRKEQNFQLSGEIDDKTAVSIGKMSGATVIVTGRIDGEGSLRRLRLRALDTQTAQVIGAVSERL